jgi:hypothetical protein
MILKKGSKGHAHAVINHRIMVILNELGLNLFVYNIDLSLIGTINMWLINNNKKRFINIFTSLAGYKFYIIKSEGTYSILQPPVVEKTDIIDVAIMYSLYTLLLSFQDEIKEKNINVDLKKIIPEQIIEEEELQRIA